MIFSPQILENILEGKGLERLCEMLRKCLYTQLPPGNSTLSVAPKKETCDCGLKGPHLYRLLSCSLVCWRSILTAKEF